MNYFKAAMLKLGSTACLALTAFQVRYFGANLAIGQLVFVRAMMVMAIIIVVMSWRGELRGAFRTKRGADHFRRGLISIAGIFSIYAALKRIPVIDVTTITFLAPLVTVAFAAFLLKEHVRFYRWIAVAVGLTGAVVMIWPYLGLAEHSVAPVAAAGAFFAICNAICIAAATVQIRVMINTESTAAISFYAALSMAVAGALALPFGWKVPNGIEIVALIGSGVTGALVQILLTESLRHAPASFIAPFEYTLLMWSFVLGFMFFGEVPSIYVLVGAAIVISAGLFVIWRERQLGLKQALEAKAVAGP